MRQLLSVVALVLLGLGSIAQAQERLLLQSTTSTQNSGFYDYILPHFEAETGIDVQVVAVGTGRAIRNAQNGDGDVLLVHARAAEEAFVAGGYGVERFDLMYNDFVILGPVDDPAGLLDAQNLQEALARILHAKQTFVSRGDDSGTHRKELEFWENYGLDPSVTRYLETGSGMGATIRMAVELQAYTISDRATWIAFQDQRDGRIVFEGDPPLNNQYGIIVVNPDLHDHINIKAANRFQDWILGETGQRLIAEFRVAGQQLFFPNAAR